MLSAKYDSKKAKQIIVDAVAEFQDEYVSGLSKAIVHTVLLDADNLVTPPVTLLGRPPVSQFRKQGWVLKRGLVVKNWKKRWFTVDADYQVVYYKSEKDTPPSAGSFPRGKPCGEISCFGYRVTNDPEEKAECIKLTPYWEDDVTRRTWHFQFGTTEEYVSWRQMFEACCHHSRNPQHKDPVRRKAFELAYSAMERSFLGFLPTGTEMEQLSLLIFRRVEKQLLPDATSTLTLAERKKQMAKTYEQAVAAILPEVQRGWGNATKEADKIQSSLETRIRCLAEPLGETIKALKSKVTAPFEAVISLIVSLLIPIKELLPKITQPMLRVQKILIESFVKSAPADRLRRGPEFDPGIEQATKLNSDPLIPTLPSKFLASCVELQESAKYTYVVEDAKTLPLTGPKLLYDCLAEQQRLLKWFVELLVMKPFNTQFATLLPNLCTPLQACVPDDQKDLIDPADVVIHMAAKAMASAIRACITLGDQAAVPEVVAGYFHDCGLNVNMHLMVSMANTKKAELRMEAEFYQKLDNVFADLAAKTVEQLRREALTCCADCLATGRARFVFSELRQLYVADVCPHRLVAAMLSDIRGISKGALLSGTSEACRLILMRSDSLSLEQIVAAFRIEDPWEKMAGQFYHERVAWKAEMAAKGTLVTLNAPGFVNVQLFVPRLERWEDVSTRPSVPIPASWDS